MSHSERQPRELEDVLRRALRMAADSVEPGADGLDRIRSRIRDAPDAAAPCCVTCCRSASLRGLPCMPWSSGSGQNRMGASGIAGCGRPLHSQPGFSSSWQAHGP